MDKIEIEIGAKKIRDSIFSPLISMNHKIHCTTPGVLLQVTYHEKYFSELRVPGSPLTVNTQSRAESGTSIKFLMN